MSSTPPEEGTEDWGDDLNNYLIGLQNRIVVLESQVDDMQEDISALEARPEHVFSSYAWTYNVGAPPATVGQVRFNTTDPMTATVMDFRKIDADGADRTPVFQQLNAGSTIRISDWDDASILHRLAVVGPVTTDATNAQIPVSWTEGAGTLPTGGNAKVNVGFLITLIV